MRKASIAIALASLFLTPVSWGCGSGDMQSCAMSDCPLMNVARQMPDCHGSSAAVSSLQQGCDLAAAASVGCCEGKIGQEPATAISASAASPESSPLAPLTEALSVEPPPRPSERAWMALETRQHELGRFTLLSAYLL